MGSSSWFFMIWPELPHDHNQLVASMYCPWLHIPALQLFPCYIAISWHFWNPTQVFILQFLNLREVILLFTILNVRWFVKYIWNRIKVNWSTVKISISVGLWDWSTTKTKRKKSIPLMLAKHCDKPFSTSNITNDVMKDLRGWYAI